VWLETDTGAVNQGMCENVGDRGMGAGFVYDLGFRQKNVCYMCQTIEVLSRLGMFSPAKAQFFAEPSAACVVWKKWPGASE